MYRWATIAVGIVHAQHTPKTQTAEISASRMAMGNVVTWPWLFQTRHCRWFGCAATPYGSCSPEASSWRRQTWRHGSLT